MDGQEFGQGTDIITLHNAVTTFPVPSASGIGADISIWATFHQHLAPEKVLIEFSSDVATTMGGPIGIYGETADGRVDLIEDPLDDSADLVIPGGAVGRSFRINCGPYTRLAIGGINGAIVPTNGAHVTVKATPVYEAHT